MMQRISEDIYKKEISNLKAQNKDLTDTINTLRSENTELKERLVILLASKKSITSEPLEISFEEKVSRSEDTDLSFFKGSITDQLSIKNEISSPMKENSIESFSGQNNIDEYKEQPEDDYIPNYVKKLLQTTSNTIEEQDSIESFSNSQKFSQKKLTTPIYNEACLTEETLESDRINLSGKNSARGTTPKADKLIAGLMVPVKQKMLAKLSRGRNTSPIGTVQRTIGKSPRRQVVTSKKKETTESEFATPHFN